MDKNPKRIAFDIDGTLCPESRISTNRYISEPYNSMKELVNYHYEIGNMIIIYTARGWNEYDITHKWLVDNGFKFHKLICGKYNYDMLIDDRAYNANDIRKYLEAKPKTGPIVHSCRLPNPKPKNIFDWESIL